MFEVRLFLPGHEIFGWHNFDVGWIALTKAVFEFFYLQVNTSGMQASCEILFKIMCQN